jgi:formate/nitrite transporter FocA (FNT family)
VAKARLDLITPGVLAMLAGVFISLGAMRYPGAVTAGNIDGDTLRVAGVYWMAACPGQKRPSR